MIQKGIAIIWGSQPIKPIVNLPRCRKVRIRMRNTSPAYAFVHYDG